MESEPLLYQIALTLIKGIGDINAKKLIAYTGSPEAVFKEGRKALSKIPGIGDYLINTIMGSLHVVDRAAEEVEFVRKYNLKTLFFTEEGYPERLKHCADSPVLIYSLGDIDFNAPKIISIVGTRRASDYGRDMCQKLVSGLKDLNVLIVSGLAFGIDTCAHKSALDEGLKTVGVLAHGLDRLYPPQNSNLAQRMQEQGGLVTDYMSGTNPDRENFPKRNRIIAGLADATIVVEAGARGGALITADIANSYNRDVFAVPGRIGDSMSEGCNNLIKTNRAALVQSAEDVLYIMGWDRPSNKRTATQKKLFVQLQPDEEAVVAILKENGDCSIDKICITSGMQTSKVAAALLNLEFEGMVRSLPGKMYRLL